MVCTVEGWSNVKRTTCVHGAIEGGISSEEGFGVVQLGDEGKVRKYREDSELSQEQVDVRLHDVKDLMNRVKNGERSEELWQQAEEHMQWWEAEMIRAQTAVANKVVPTTGGGSSRRKHHYSKEYVAMVQQYRGINKLWKMWQRNSSSQNGYLSMKLVKRVKKKLGDRLPGLGSDGEIPDKYAPRHVWGKWMNKLNGFAGARGAWESSEPY